ncbi:MAG: FtsX-like permease family protein, partial [Tepidiforma sp.]
MTFSLSAVVTAIVEPLRADDPFWVLPADRFFAPYRLLPENGPVVPMFVPEETLLDAFASQFPAYGAGTAWHTYARPEALSRETFERARADLSALYYDLEPLGGASFSPLGNVLRDYGRAQQYQQAPLTILLLEIAAVAVFYVILVSIVLTERLSDEVALLRSRGATVAQVGVITLAEGLILGAPIVLVAPLAAAAGTALLGLTPTFEPVNGGALLPVSLPPEAFVYAAAGVAVSIAALLVPALLAARSSAVARRREQARPGKPLFQRYYLDLVLAGFAALLLWELRERGTVFRPSPTGGVTSDPLLLLSPTLFMVMVALVFLRLFPLVLGLIARAGRRWESATVALGLTRMTRAPLQYNRLILLLLLATAVGMFAAGYR